MEPSNPIQIINDCIEGRNLYYVPNEGDSKKIAEEEGARFPTLSPDAGPRDIIKRVKEIKKEISKIDKDLKTQGKIVAERAKDVTKSIIKYTETESRQDAKQVAKCSKVHFEAMQCQRSIEQEIADLRLIKKTMRKQAAILEQMEKDEKASQSKGNEKKPTGYIKLK